MSEELFETGQNRRPFRKVLGMTLVFIFLLAVLVVAGGWFYFQAKLDKIHFVEGAEPLQDETISGIEGGSIGELTYFNILLLGTDERSAGGSTEDFSPELLDSARADACMLLSLNLKEHTAKLVSLERAIGVPIEGHGEDWLTHTFAYGGAQMTLKAVQDLTGIDVRRYARVNVSAAAQLIDLIGGVDIELTETEAAALNGEIYTNATAHTRVHPGLNHLDGYDALAYGRQRFIDDDFHRVQRQRNVLQAAIDQTKNLSIWEINHLLDEALPLVETNLSKKEISDLVLKAPGFLGVQMEQMTLPLKGMYGNKLTEDGRSLMMLDPEETSRILHEFFYTDSFDPQTYEASEEVVNRVWAAQQKAAVEWAAAHPEESEEEQEQEEREEPEEEDWVPLEVDENGYYRSESGLLIQATEEQLEEIRRRQEEATEQEERESTDQQEEDTASSREEPAETEISSEGSGARTDSSQSQSKSSETETVESVSRPSKAVLQSEKKN